MTREEQIRNEAIDFSEYEDNFLEYDDYGNVCDDRDFIQRAFEEGAKWADKTMIEKACKWLENNVENYITQVDSNVYDSDVYSNLIGNFKSYLTEVLVD